MEEITEKLLDKIFYLQEDLAQKRQENTNTKKNLKKYRDIIDYLREEKSKQEKKNKNDEIRAFYIGIGLTIFVYLFIKLLLWYFF